MVQTPPHGSCLFSQSVSIKIATILTAVLHGCEVRFLSWKGRTHTEYLRRGMLDERGASNRRGGKI